MDGGAGKRDGARVDAVTGATQWKVDSPLAAAIPAPGQPMSAEDERALRKTADAKDGEGSEGEANAPDAVTGATPGVASACAELGMSSLGDVVDELGIKPPGMA